MFTLILNRELSNEEINEIRRVLHRMESRQPLKYIYRNNNKITTRRGITALERAAMKVEIQTNLERYPLGISTASTNSSVDSSSSI